LRSRFARRTAANWAGSGSYRWNWQPYRRNFPTDLFEDDDPPPPAPALADAVLDSLIATRASFLNLAASLHLKPRHFTCTLLTVVVHVATGDAVAAQLGDGTILNIEDLAPACPVPPPNSVDNPFTMADDDWRDGLRIAPTKAKGFLLMTDGAEAFFPEQGPACREMLMQPGDDAQHALRLLGWLQSLSKPGCEDDRTLAAILQAGRTT